MILALALFAAATALAALVHVCVFYCQQPPVPVASDPRDGWRQPADQHRVVYDRRETA